MRTIPRKIGLRLFIPTIIIMERSQKNPQKLLKCEVCCRVFKANSYLKIHMNKNNCRKTLECDVCPQVMKNFQAFQAHKKLYCQRQFAEHKCEMCLEIFLTSSILKKHVMNNICTEPKPWTKSKSMKLSRVHLSLMIPSRYHLRILFLQSLKQV